MTGETESLGREAGAAVRWNAGASAATLISQLLQLIVLARWLAPAEFGLAATALSLAALAQGLTDLGLTNALVQRSRIDKESWASALWACLLGGVVLCAGMSAASPLLAGLLHLPGLAPLAGAASLTLLWTGPASVYQADLQRRLRFSSLALAEISAAAVSLAVALGWAFWRREAMALVAGQVALFAGRCGFLFLASPLRAAFRLRWADLRPMASFGGYQMGERVLNYAAANLDRLLVARLLGAASAGYYTVASQIALRPLALLAPFVFRTLFPLFARVQGQRERLASSLLRAMSLLSPLAAGMFALLFGLAEPLCRVVLGEKWLAAVPLLRILTALGFLWAVSNPLASLMLALGRAGTAFAINALTVLLNAVAVWTGAAAYGLAGAAWGMVIAAFLLTPLDFVLARRWIGVKPAALAAAMGWALPAALAAALAQREVGHWIAGLSPWRELALKLPLGVAAFLFAAWILQGRRSREAVRELVSKLRGG